MRLELQPGQIHVYLSQRNLLALLSKLQGLPVDSKKTLMLETEAGALLVTAESDEEHYLDRPPPGPMHSLTEAGIARAQERRPSREEGR